MMHTETEWALVADAQRARILERRIPGAAWSERAGEGVEISNPRSHERGSDRPGRTQESASSARHAIEPRTDPHREAKRAFAHELAERLEAAASAGHYARLLLVAPPAFLGDLRAALGQEAGRRLRGSLDKDLSHAPLAEIVPHLDGIGRDAPG